MRKLSLLLSVFLLTVSTGCSGTKENPLYFTLDCIDNQLMVFHTKNGVKQQIVLTAAGATPMQANSTFILECKKNGNEIVVNDTTVIPFVLNSTLRHEGVK